MLRSTFVSLVRGINAQREEALWRAGIMSWDDFDNQQPVQQAIFPDFSEPSSPLSQARAALHSGDMDFFAKALDPKEHFRIALEVPERTLFLDIETTGLSRYYDIVTLVGWSYQKRFQVFIQGDAEDSLRQALADARVVVTFNGSMFDLPFLRTHFKDLPVPPVHVDLRFLAKRVGLTGGQKAIEELLGFKRKGKASDIRGEAAPVLWHRYRRGDMKALKLLIEYNHLDVEGMKFIFDKVVAKLVEEKRVPKGIRDRIPKLAKPSKLKLVNSDDVQQSAADAIRLFPYQGAQGPSIRLSDLRHPTDSAPIRVIGIDLTGSEHRPTGWCLLEGNQVITRCVRSDEELISASIDTRPHVVSIDSPLSLPRGRVTVSDDDPGRDQYGIMRYCERVLKKRGINVYPALIPSMQKLTARGIRLAAAFRSRGIPVIESYPGAAQDIMGIPRKRASLEMLREGLREFGVTGEFLEKQVTHDELDAITASIVGAFFWGGRFESLGDDDEEALIIPDLSRNPQTWQTRRVVGFSGPIAAGKTTAARFLENAGFHYARYSMVVESLLTHKDERPTRDQLQEHGARIHRDHGQRWLGKRLLELVPTDGNLVVDGLRFPDDHAFLVESFGPAFLHVHIEAPKDVRETRFGSRHDTGRNFAEAEAHPVESRIPELRGLAHIAITNETSPESFQSKLLSFA